MTRLLLRGDHVLVGDGTVLSPGWVLVSGRSVVSVGSGPEPPDVDRVIGGRHRIVMPGFINGHTHLFQTFLRNLADDLDHTSWLGTVISANAARLTAEDLSLSASLGAVENLRSGITTIVDNAYVNGVPGAGSAATDAVAGALLASGVRAWVARGSADRAEALAAAAGPDAVKVTCEAPDVYLGRVSEAAARWHGGRVSIAVATQAAWLCSDSLAAGLASFASDNGLLFHAHCAETTTSVKRTLDAHGTTDEGFFSRAGLVRPGSSLVHGVHLGDDELADIASGGAAVVHCPVANAYLASGIAPVPAMVAAGIPVATGTDGAASNDRQDGFEVLKLASLLPRLSGSLSLGASAVLDLCWSGGAAALGLSGRLGVLAPGALADVVVVSTEGAHLRPLHDPAAAIVFNARPSDVDTVVVDGAVVLDGGVCTTLDEAALLARCDVRSRELGLEARR